MLRVLIHQFQINTKNIQELDLAWTYPLSDKTRYALSENISFLRTYTPDWESKDEALILSMMKSWQ
jgi:hypothetical protein